ncbi:MAG: hypothetical protein ACRDJ2_09835 [Actinomycetota bacterium]
MRKTLRSLLGVALALSLTSGAAFSASAADDAGERTVARPQRVKIVAMDYHYMGVKETYKPKRTIFSFTNEGEQDHMAVIIKMLHGKTLQQLLDMPDKKAEKHIKFIGDLFAKAGKSSKQVIDTKLKTGRYAMLCFAQDSDQAPPHFTQGMIHKFKVRN